MAVDNLQRDVGPIDVKSILEGINSEVVKLSGDDLAESQPPQRDPASAFERAVAAIDQLGSRVDQSAIDQINAAREFANQTIEAYQASSQGKSKKSSFSKLAPDIAAMRASISEIEKMGSKPSTFWVGIGKFHQQALRQIFGGLKRAGCCGAMKEAISDVTKGESGAITAKSVERAGISQAGAAGIADITRKTGGATVATMDQSPSPEAWNATFGMGMKLIGTLTNLFTALSQAFELKLSDAWAGTLQTANAFRETLREIRQQTEGYSEANRGFEEPFQVGFDLLRLSGKEAKKFYEIMLENQRKGYEYMDAQDAAIDKQLKGQKKIFDAEKRWNDIRAMRLKHLTGTALHTASVLSMDANVVNDVFYKWHQQLGLSALEIGTMSQHMKTVAKESGITGKRLENALTSADQIAQKLRNAGFLSTAAAKNITSMTAAFEKFGVGAEGAELLKVLSSRTAWREADDTTKAWTMRIAKASENPREIQSRLIGGTLEHSPKAMKQFYGGMDADLKRMVGSQAGAIQQVLKGSGRTFNKDTFETKDLEELMRSIEEQASKGASESATKEERKMGEEANKLFGILGDTIKMATGREPIVIQKMIQSGLEGAKTYEDRINEFSTKLKGLTEGTELYTQTQKQLRETQVSETQAALTEFASIIRNRGKMTDEQVQESLRTRLTKSMGEGRAKDFATDIAGGSSKLIADLMKATGERAKEQKFDIDTLAKELSGGVFKDSKSLQAALTSKDKDVMEQAQTAFQQIDQRIAQKENVAADPMKELRDNVKSINDYLTNKVGGFLSNIGDTALKVLGFVALISTTLMTIVAAILAFKAFRAVGGVAAARDVWKGSAPGRTLTRMRNRPIAGSPLAQRRGASVTERLAEVNRRRQRRGGRAPITMGRKGMLRRRRLQRPGGKLGGMIEAGKSLMGGGLSEFLKGEGMPVYVTNVDEICECLTGDQASVTDLLGDLPDRKGGRARRGRKGRARGGRARARGRAPRLRGPGRAGGRVGRFARGAGTKAASFGTKAAGFGSKGLKAIGGAKGLGLLSLGIGGLVGLLGAKEAKRSKLSGAAFGALTGGADTGSMFSGMLGIKEKSAGDEALGIAGAAGVGAMSGAGIGTMIAGPVGTAVGAGVGAIVGSVAEIVKIFTAEQSALREEIKGTFTGGWEKTGKIFGYAIENFGDSWDKLWSGDILGSVGSLAGSFLRTIQGSVSIVSSAVMSIGSALGSTASYIWGAVVGVGSAIAATPGYLWDGVKTVGSAIGSTASYIWDSAKEMGSAIVAIPGQALEGIKNVGNYIKESAISAGGYIKEGAIIAGSAIIALPGQALEGIKSIGYAIGTGANYLLDITKSIGSSLIAIPGYLLTGVQSITSAIASIPSFILSTIEGTVSTLTSIPGMILDWIISGLKTLSVNEWVGPIFAPVLEIFQLLRKIVDQVLEPFVIIWNTLKQVFTEVLNVFSPFIEMFKTIGGMFAELFTPLIESWDAVKKSISDIMVAFQPITDLFVLFKETLVVIWDEISVALKPVINFFSWLKEAIFGASKVTESIQGVSSAVAETSSNLPILIGFLKGLIQGIGNLITIGLFPLKVILKGVSLFLQAFSGVLTFLSKVVIFTLQTALWPTIRVFELVAKTISSFVKLALWPLQTVFNVVGAVITSIAGTVSETAGLISAPFKSLYSFLTGEGDISDLLLSVVDLFTKLPMVIVGGLVDIGWQILKALGNSLLQIPSLVWNIFDTVFSGIPNFLYEKISSGLSGIGKWISDTVSSGLSSIGNWLYDTFTAALQKVWDWLVNLIPGAKSAVEGFKETNEESAARIAQQGYDVAHGFGRAAGGAIDVITGGGEGRLAGAQKLVSGNFEAAVGAVESAWEGIKSVTSYLNPFSWFQTGTMGVDKEGLAYVHKGETIIPADAPIAAGEQGFNPSDFLKQALAISPIGAMVGAIGQGIFDVKNPIEAISSGISTMVGNLFPSLFDGKEKGMDETTERQDTKTLIEKAITLTTNTMEWLQQVWNSLGKIGGAGGLGIGGAGGLGIGGAGGLGIGGAGGLGIGLAPNSITESIKTVFSALSEPIRKVFTSVANAGIFAQEQPVDALTEGVTSLTSQVLSPALENISSPITGVIEKIQSIFETFKVFESLIANAANLGILDKGQTKEVKLEEKISSDVFNEATKLIVKPVGNIIEGAKTAFAILTSPIGDIISSMINTGIFNKSQSADALSEGITTLASQIIKSQSDATENTKNLHMIAPDKPRTVVEASGIFAPEQPTDALSQGISGLTTLGGYETTAIDEIKDIYKSTVLPAKGATFGTFGGGIFAPEQPTEALTEGITNLAKQTIMPGIESSNIENIQDFNNKLSSAFASKMTESQKSFVESGKGMQYDDLTKALVQSDKYSDMTQASIEAYKLKEKEDIARNFADTAKSLYYSVPEATENSQMTAGLPMEDLKKAIISAQLMDYTEQTKGQTYTNPMRYEDAEGLVSQKVYGEVPGGPSAMISGMDTVSEYLTMTQQAILRDMLETLEAIKQNTTGRSTSSIIGPESNGLKSSLRPGVKSMARDFTRGRWDLTFSDNAAGAVTTEGRGGSA